MDVKYYRDIDSEAIYACLGPMAAHGLFRLVQPLIRRAKWEFLVPNSPVWDSVHQSIYRNPRVEEIDPASLSAPLPPLPEPPRGPFPQWKEYFVPQEPIRASKFPSVAKFISASGQKTVTLFVVLYEDTYETSLGDGEFHYFRDVFLAREEAERRVDENREEWTRLHLRSMSVALEGTSFQFPDFSPQLFDHYTPEEVLAACEARLRGTSAATK